MIVDFEALLRREESAKLDFKQVVGFNGGTEHQRGELLKDIIAMANTDPGEPAYLIYGVKKEPAQLPRIKGLRDNDVIDTASLTQFVSSNVNRSIDLVMARHCAEDKILIALIITPDGDIRYATKKVGSTNMNIAYRRDNDSTSQMTPDEITDLAVRRNRPKLALSIVSVDNGSPPIEVRNITLRRLIRSDEYFENFALRRHSATDLSPDKQSALEALMGTPEQRAAQEALASLLPKIPEAFEKLFSEDNKKKREIMLKRFSYMRDMALLQKVHVVVLNTGKCLASHCNVHLVIPNPNGTVLFETEDTLAPEPPSWSPGGLMFQVALGRVRAGPTKLGRMTAGKEEYAIALSLGNIQAGNHGVSEGFYIGASAAQNLAIRYTILFDEPGSPQHGEIPLGMEVEDTPVSDGEILQATCAKSR